MKGSDQDIRSITDKYIKKPDVVSIPFIPQQYRKIGIAAYVYPDKNIC